MNFIIIRNMKQKEPQHATTPLIIVNKTISFYLQHVFVRIVLILLGQLTGAAVDVVDAEAFVMVSVVVCIVCMWTPWARTARIIEVNVHSMVGGRTGTETLSYQNKFFSGLSLFTSWDFPLICRSSLCFNFDE
jgi:hypothetical protein